MRAACWNMDTRHHHLAFLTMNSNVPIVQMLLVRLDDVAMVCRGWICRENGPADSCKKSS
jgi:hypothetical protein